MGLFILLFLPFRLVSVFTSFTFTDPEDFTPLLSLLIGVACAVLLGHSSGTKISRPLAFSLNLLSLWPILPNLGLFFLALELKKVHGFWPQAMVDDPRNWYGDVSPKYDSLFHSIAYLEAFSGAWMIVFFALFFAINPRLSSQQRKSVLLITFTSLLLAFLDLGHLYAWWLD